MKAIEGPAVLWLRLSDACQRLRAVGIGDADLLETIARSALLGRFVATGFQAVHIGREYYASPDRLPVRRMMWRKLRSEKAPGAGYRRWIGGDDLICTRGDHIDNVTQEAWRSVFVDALSFEEVLRDLRVRARPPKVTAEETETWITNCSESNSKTAWAAYRHHYGNRAGKRDEDFQPSWLRVHGAPSRGRPKKSPNGKQSA